ncbi:hypothetical protein [Streptomyces sp. NPDC047014]|uniref:hypothetical protein n=1 Tax=Streptomyces sp. NPDC047014 TaxID=3155736 RepID=UPI0033FBC9AB
MTGNESIEPSVQHMRWRLGGAGWASWLWSVEEEQLRVAASYAMQPQALGDFMTGVRDLLLGCSATFVTLFDEPNGTRVFFNQDGEEVFVQVVSYPCLWEPADWWTDAKLVWAGRVSTHEFVNAFIRMVEELLSEHGTDGYSRNWCHAFPAEEWASLRAAYNLPNHPPPQAARASGPKT